MGRIPAGQKPEPLADRLKRYRQGLEAQGGRRIIVDLNPDAGEALQQIIEREGLGDARDKIKRAVSAALLHFAKKRTRG